MQSKDVPVAYRDKEANKNVSLGSIAVDVPDTVDEAIQLYGQGDDGKGAEILLSLSSDAWIIQKQSAHRQANRPDRPKTTSNVSKFKQLSQESQDDLLKQAGIL